MSPPSNAELTNARRQRDSALADAMSAQKMVEDALAQLGPAQKQAKSGWADMKRANKMLTAKRLIGKGRRRRALVAIMVPEISKAYMLSYRRAPRAISVINSIVKGLRATKKELDGTVEALRAINIPTGATINPVALASVPGQVDTAKAKAAAAVARADKLMANCSRYQKKSVPFLKATSTLLKKTQRLASKRIRRLKDRKLVLFAKKARIKGYKTIVRKTARFQAKIDGALTQIKAFIRNCPNERRKISMVGAKISSISLPTGSPNSLSYGAVAPLPQRAAAVARNNEGLLMTLALVGGLAAAAHFSDD